MLILKGLVAVAAFAQAVTAFHPWYPDYRCAKLKSCPKKSTRDLEGRPQGTTVKIVQRLPKNDSPHEEQIRRLAERLSYKYGRGTIKSTPVRQEHNFDKRVGNVIVPAATPTTTNSAGIDQDGTDFSYFTKVKLGSQGTVVNLLLDTGAGTSWVMGTDCTSDPCKTRNSFGAGDSTTFKEAGHDFEIHYGSGDVSGYTVTDTLALAGFQINATFGIAIKTSPDFNNFPIDGILGLATSKGPNPTFWQTLQDSKVLKSNLFGVSINRASDGPNNGVINFGTIDASRFTGSLSYTAVSPSHVGDWAVPLDEISYDGKKAGIQVKLAYIDTGTSYMFSSEEEVKRLHDTIPGSSSTDGITYQVPCTTTQDLNFVFSGKSYAVSSRDWVGPMVNGNCTSNVYGHDVVGDGWLLGDSFLKNVYAVFDIDQSRIGFAPNPAPPVSISTSTTGGPISSSSTPSATLQSSGTTSIPGPSSTMVQSSNGSQTESSTATATPSASPTASTAQLESEPTTSETPSATESSTPPGMGGHQTSDQSTSVAESVESSSTPSPTHSNQSGAIQLQGSLARTAVAILALFTLIS